MTHSVLEYFDSGNSRVTKKEYFPIFYFTKLAGMSVDDFSEKLKSFYFEKKKQYEDRLDGIRSTRVVQESTVKNLDDLKDLLDNHPLKFYRSDMIFYYFDTGLISENEAKNLLIELKGSGLRNSEYTAFRCAISYLPFKNYEK